MKRCLHVALVFLIAVPGLASAQMSGGGRMGGGDAPAAAPKEAEQMPASGMGGGMMGQGMMSGMMGEPKEMMGGCMMMGGMMGPEMMGSMMPSMMDRMMPGMTRGSMMMAEGMMKGQIDRAQLRKTLGLSDEQADRLRAGLRPLQKEAILTLASLKVSELELSDILAGDPVDFGKVEAKLKEAEGMRTKIRLAHLRAAELVKGVLSKEQLDKIRATGEAPSGPPAPGSPQQGGVPAAGSGHEQHH